MGWGGKVQGRRRRGRGDVRGSKKRWTSCTKPILGPRHIAPLLYRKTVDKQDGNTILKAVTSTACMCKSIEKLPKY